MNINILQINTNDFHGGAAQVTHLLKNGLNLSGNRSTMLVANKSLADDQSFLINYDQTIRYWSKLSKKIIGKDLPSFIKFKIRDFFRAGIANDIEFFSNDLENFEEYKKADIIHLHNLHGNYFNLKSLRTIAKEKPIVWTLHDMWAFTGHCSYSYACDKWQSECKECPDLSIYPALYWDNTRYLFRKRKKIYDNLRLNIIVPSLWLKQKVEKSILKDQNINLIYNGINIDELKPYNKILARNELKLPVDKKIILFLAAGGKNDDRKGWNYTEEIIKFCGDYLFLCIGGKSQEKQVKNLININYIESKEILAKYLSAADIFLFPSLAENFPLVILEAMACGTPIVSFDVGGVKEAMVHSQNGYIAKYKDIKDLLSGIKYLSELDNNETRRMAENSIERVKNNFSLEIMTEKYSKLYQKIINEKRHE